MQGATLHPRLACGAAPRRCWPTPARPGTRVCVIVPSKDNASGSSGKRVPLLWTYSDLGSSRGVHKHKQVLEEVFTREVEEPPHYSGSTPTTVDPDLDRHLGQQEGAQQEQQEEHPLNSLNGHWESRQLEPVNAAVEGPERQEQQEQEAEALRERIASAALASTSEHSWAHHRAPHHHQAQQRHNHHNHQQPQPPLIAQYVSQQQQQQLEQVQATINGVSHLNGSVRSVHILDQQQQQVIQHQDTSTDLQLDPTSTQLERSLHSQQHHHHHHKSSSSSKIIEPQHSLMLQQPLLLHDASRRQLESDAGPTASVTRNDTMGAPVVAAAATATAGGSTTARDTSIPASIWILCCISAALTCASCVFNTALPIYMVSELKMSMRSMGMFEGLLEAFSYVVRMCSGVVSDRMTSRKAAITLGFAAGAAAKFGMAGAGSVGVLFAAKAVDRLANGIQAAPRDALIGDLSPPGVRSSCFGLAQSLRKWGSAVGALAAFFLMKASNNNYQLIFYSASMVSLVACIAFVVFVPAHTRVAAAPAPAPVDSSGAGSNAAAASAGARATSSPLASSSSGLLSGARAFARSVASMGSDFYRMLGVISLYALGHINESLLEARAMEVGFGKAEATLVVAAIAAVTFLTAYPLGRLDDRYGAGTTFAVGIGALIAGDLVLLLSGPHPLALFASCLFLGVHWAVIQGPLLSIVSGLAPAHMRGTAFGIFYTVMAVTAVGANTMYGSIWHTYGANAAFATSAALMSAVLAALPYMLPACARRGVTGAAAVPGPATGPTMLGSVSPLPAAA